MTATHSATGTPYGTIPPASPLPVRKPVSLPRLAQMRAAGEKITMLTAYDATFAAVADAAGVECILVGDSLGMVCQGLHSTVGVSLEDMCYHTASVARGLHRAQGTAWLVSDLPYGSYQESREQALRSASALMQAGAHMVKLEGAGFKLDIIAYLAQRDIPVCSHLGLTPQSVLTLGGFRVQGRGEAGQLVMEQARAVAQAGASLLVLECMPSPLAAQITAASPIPTIGIGAGPDCDGQVLVLHDMLGLDSGHRRPKFVKDFLAQGGSVDGAVQAYVAAVRDRSFPDAEHAYAS